MKTQIYRMKSKLFKTLVAVLILLSPFSSLLSQSSNCEIVDISWERDCDGRVYFSIYSEQDSILNIATIWNFGDGQTAIGNPVDHKYDAPTVYTVCVQYYLIDSFKYESCCFTLDLTDFDTSYCDDCGYDLTTNCSEVDSLYSIEICLEANNPGVNNEWIVIPQNVSNTTPIILNGSSPCFTIPIGINVSNPNYGIDLEIEQRIDGKLCSKSFRLANCPPVCENTSVEWEQDCGNRVYFSITNTQGYTINNCKWNFGDGTEAIGGSVIDHLFPISSEFTVCVEYYTDRNTLVSCCFPINLTAFDDTECSSCGFDVISTNCYTQDSTDFIEFCLQAEDASANIEWEFIPFSGTN